VFLHLSAGAAAGSGRRCELSLEDRDGFFSIRQGLQCQCRQEKNWGGARATLGAFAGRVYYEVRLLQDAQDVAGSDRLFGASSKRYVNH
jgi:hypothetical protein